MSSLLVGEGTLDEMEMNGRQLVNPCRLVTLIVTDDVNQFKHSSWSCKSRLDQPCSAVLSRKWERASLFSSPSNAEQELRLSQSDSTYADGMQSILATGCWLLQIRSTRFTHSYLRIESTIAYNLRPRADNLTVVA